ncbi:MAG: hypothetical protein IJF92_04815 [Bacilli bacterium]|nr:hypothetical protein [Bacilli bacterium]
MSKKKLRIIVIVAIVFVLFIGLITVKYFMNTDYFKFGSSNGVYYTAIGHGCRNESGLYKEGYNPKGVCYSNGYHIINKNKVIITSTTTCGVKLTVKKIKIKKNMNVEVKLGNGSYVNAMQCFCSPNLTIKFSKNIKSIKVIDKNGKRIRSCSNSK